MHKKSFLPLIILLALLYSINSVAQHQKPDAITGFWYNEEKTSKLQVYKEGNKYFAKIVWLKDPNVNGKPRTDNLNPDAKLRNRPLMGLVVLKNFVFDGDDQWDDGTIYDPKNGKTYDCYIEVDSPGKLKIRGYVGVSLLGRTTYWTRAEEKK